MSRQAVAHLHKPSQGWVIYRLPALVVVVAVVMLISLLIFILSTLVGVRYMQLQASPLAAYTDIFPGQPASALEVYNCVVPANVSRGSNPVPQDRACGLYPPEGPFHLIRADVRDGLIVKLTLYADSLTPETVFSFWGDPDHMRRGASGHTFRLEWDNVIYSATVMVVQPERMVNMISLEAK